MHDQEVAKHAVENLPFYLRWTHEIVAASGVIVLGILKAVGARELEKREAYATDESIGESEGRLKEHITLTIKPLVDRMEQAEKSIGILHGRLDRHLDKCDGTHHNNGCET